MKILGEANNRALARNNPVKEVILRGDPIKVPTQFSINLLIEFFFSSAFLFVAVLDLIINNYELIKITSQ
jgi:hypothetical protein